MTGDELQKKCNNNGWTQQRLAEITGFSIAWIQENWRRGKKEITPRLENKVKKLEVKK